MFIKNCLIVLKATPLFLCNHYKASNLYIVYFVITCRMFLLGKKVLEKMYMKIQAFNIIGKSIITIRRASLGLL